MKCASSRTQQSHIHLLELFIQKLVVRARGTINIEDWYYYYLIGSRYKTIHQVMYKTKDKERKERTRARLLYT